MGYRVDQITWPRREVHCPTSSARPGDIRRGHGGTFDATKYVLLAPDDAACQRYARNCLLRLTTKLCRTSGICATEAWPTRSPVARLVDVIVRRRRNLLRPGEAARYRNLPARHSPHFAAVRTSCRRSAGERSRHHARR